MSYLEFTVLIYLIISYMFEIIAVVLQKVEVIMEKYGFWKVTGICLFGIFLWQFSNIINSFAKLIEVLK